VLGERPVRDELKLPVPEPSLVLVSREIVGVGLVDHTTPLAVMGALPSAVILPPDVAEFVVMAVIAVVVSLGIETMEFVSLRQRTENPLGP
jgi:hypothetical protein